MIYLESRLKQTEEHKKMTKGNQNEDRDSQASLNPSIWCQTSTIKSCRPHRSRLIEMTVDHLLRATCISSSSILLNSTSLKTRYPRNYSRSFPILTKSVSLTKRELKCLFNSDGNSLRPSCRRRCLTPSSPTCSPSRSTWALFTRWGWIRTLLYSS